ncbi:hypothetical protein SAMN05519104_8061 [Rhizobiales bacterium GAS188]|nr:hypothetical protein SAMN05519104_8061 [Rhizobiales bacterium GAS188]
MRTIRFSRIARCICIVRSEKSSMELTPLHDLFSENKQGLLQFQGGRHNVALINAGLRLAQALGEAKRA